MTSVVNAAASGRRPRTDAGGAVAAPRRRALARLLSAAVFSALVAILPLASALFGIVRQTAQRGEQGFVLQYLAPGSGYAQFINKNHFAYLAEMSLGLLLGLAAWRGVARRKILIPLALAVPVWAALVLSNSRGGVLAMLCQVVLLGATFGAGRRGDASAGVDSSAASRIAASPVARVGLVALLLLLIVVGMVWVGGDPLADRMSSVGGEVTAQGPDPTRTGRAEIWKAT